MELVRSHAACPHNRFGASAGQMLSPLLEGFGRGLHATFVVPLGLHRLRTASFAPRLPGGGKVRFSGPSRSRYRRTRSPRHDPS